MKVFFDCEFTGLHKDTTLISIGMVAKDGATFYAELTDYDTSQVDNWIKENVIDNLIIDTVDALDNMDNCERMESSDTCVKSITCRGNKENVRKSIMHWFSQWDTIDFISDVCHYDMVLLIDLLADSALDVPQKISCACYDINQDISRFYNCSQKEAFDMSREDILKDFRINIDGKKHNALYDALVIKEIYNGLNNF